MKPLPYIGVTGLGTIEETETIANYLNNSKNYYEISIKAKTPYLVMLGVTCSNKRLADPQSSGSTSPSLREASKIFRSMPLNSLRMVHYFTENESQLAEEICTLIKKPFPVEASLIGETILQGTTSYSKLSRGLQINQAWPKLNDLHRIIKEIPDLQITLQLPKETLSNRTSEIVEKMKVYGDSCQYVLIDPSGGQGHDFDMNYCCDLLSSLDDSLPNTTVGVAGGFSADNVGERIANIASRVKKPFCVDAQGKLRTNNKLDTQKVKDYLTNAFEALEVFHGF